MILCSGEALIDMVAASTADGEPAYVARPGGSPLNVAVSLGRLAIPVGLFAGISTDHFGTILLKTLQSNNVDTTHVRLASRPTTLASHTFAMERQATHSTTNTVRAGC